MRGKHLTKTNSRNEDDSDSQPSWLNWCRLCAKRELNDQENSSIFSKKEAGKRGTDLATSVGKYFWVNIKADDEISQSLCWECRELVEELITFTERVNKVQTLFCLLQNIKPKTSAEAVKFRLQCGLDDEGWQHIIKPEPVIVPTPPKTFLIDQQVQTDLYVASKNEKEQVDGKTALNSTEEIISILRKNDKNEEYKSQAESENEQGYEYVMQCDNDMEFVENEEFIVPSNSLDHEEIQRNEMVTEVEEEEMDEEDVQDSDLFKELKYKVDDEEDEQKTKRFKIISQEEEVEIEYQDNSQTLHQHEDEDMEESVEVLEEDDDEDYVNTGESKNEVNVNAFEILKSKRGRPFGSKKFDSDNSFYRYECKECKRRYKNPTVFRKHMVTLHDTIIELPELQPTTSCNVCNKEFPTQSSLKLHMRHHLPDEEKFHVPCPYCERKFSQVGAMRQHVNGIHHQMKPYICDQCGRACKTMAALTEHQLVHTNERPFECEVCHKTFKNKPRLKTHMDTHNKSVYKCPECDLELNTRRTLQHHRLVHSDVRSFKCEFCDAAFKRSKALKNHLILHSGLRPYKCNYCNRTFSNGSNFRAHKKRSHPQELAEEDATGKVAERVPMPKLEELKSAKGILVQPRKVKRAGGLRDKYLKILQTEKRKEQENSHDYVDVGVVDKYESYSDFNYKSEIDETESLIDNPNEECEETVIYEIIDEI